MAYIDDVVAAVRGLTNDPREQAAMLFACGAESGCAPIQNRQGAPAYGPWQIYLPIHKTMTIATANNPRTAASYMYNHMNVPECVKSQDWSNPQQALLLAARCIEHASPQEQYSPAQIAQAQAIVSKYVSTTGATSGKSGTADNGNVTVQVGPAQIELPRGQNPISAGVSGAFQMIGNAIAALLSTDLMERALLILVGLILIGSGISALTHLPEHAAQAGAVAAAAA